MTGSELDGAYRLTRLISEGGMGTVYEALQIRLNRKVAVKIMVPELAANAEALARFRREVEVTSQLAHPHVIHLVDFGATRSGQPYLVMEYLDGEDLSQRLARVKALPLDAAVEIVNQVASALTATHAKGIVHRDLKPANLFLLRTDGAVDFVKLVDYGISKVRASSEKLTRASIMIGTPSYMSPEQALGKVDDVDHRTDQWALACIAWEMLSGRVPFEGTDLNVVVKKVTHEEPPRLAAQVPSGIEPTLRRALSKAPGDRFPTVAAFARAFEAAAAPAAVPARRGAGMWVVTVLVSLALGGALYQTVAKDPTARRWMRVFGR